jgi:hypothetical protein
MVQNTMDTAETELAHLMETGLLTEKSMTAERVNSVISLWDTIKSHLVTKAMA